jgi:hypothetical protein
VIQTKGALTVDGISTLTGAVTASAGITIDGATQSNLIAAKSTANLFNTSATTINFGAAATTGINIGASGGTVAIAGPVTIANGQTFTANGEQQSVTVVMQLPFPELQSHSLQMEQVMI